MWGRTIDGSEYGLWATPAALETWNIGGNANGLNGKEKQTI
jgi:hypothetical protein